MVRTLLILEMKLVLPSARQYSSVSVCGWWCEQFHFMKMCVIFQGKYNVIGVHKFASIMCYIVGFSCIFFGKTLKQVVWGKCSIN